MKINCPNCGGVNVSTRTNCGGCGTEFMSVLDRFSLAEREEVRMNAMAAKIAFQNEKQVRQRMDEMRNPQKYWTPEQKRRNTVAIIFWVGIFIVIMIFALSIGH